MESTINLNQTATKTESNFKSVMLPAILTSQAAGLIMAVVVMAVFTIFLGKNPLFPVQVIGSTLFGAEALEGIHIGAVLAGLVLHQLGPALLWGTLFAVLANKLNITTVKKSLIVGTGIGVLAMTGPYILIPAVMKTLHGVDFWNQEVPIFWDWAAHIVFGASFALYPLIKNYKNA